MTDATHAVTQSALEAFAREYLSELGATIRADGDRWRVELPSNVDVEFTDSHEFDVVLGSETGADLDSERILSPESGFTQQLLAEASEVAPVGQLALTEAVTNGEYQYPPWILESDVEVDDATFSPYYDRTAICVFVSIELETVSEYQTQFLEAVTVDLESNEPLPNTTELILANFFAPESTSPAEATGADVSGGETIPTEKLRDAFLTGQKAAVQNIEAEIADIRQSASRAADSEFEEYRQLQEQRLNELQNEISSLSTRLQELSSEVDGAQSPQQRVDALEKRKELKEEKEQIESEVEGILQEKANGYSQQKQEIDRRHAIKVNTELKAFSIVLYERGEIEFELGTNGRVALVRAPYAIGAGVTDDVRCENCKKLLSGENPVCVSTGSVCCRYCR